MNVKLKLSEGNLYYKTHMDAASQMMLVKNGQHPYAVIICCSDSRVIPEQIFHAKTGELFVIRVAGNVLGEQQMGSIEYAVGHLGCKHVIVLGHSDCGAIAAALSGEVNGFVSSITNDILAAIGKERNPDRACCLNVEHTVNHLKQNLRNQPALADVVVEGAVYDIRTGDVSWM